MSFGSSKLGGTAQDHRQQLARAVHLLLLWVADSDGDLEESELAFAAAQFPGPEGDCTDELLSVVREGDINAIEAAIGLLAHESRELRKAFLDMAITMAMVDRRVAVTENHILRFYADALHLGERILEDRFRVISGSDLTEPEDPDSPAWWADDSHDMPVDPERVVATGQMNVQQARALLGVGPGASHSDIEKAYRRLAEVFLARRVEAMGAAAIAVARMRSRKLKEAYSLLTG